MRRYLIHVSTSISVLLLLVCAALWIHSHVAVLGSSLHTERRVGPDWYARQYLFRNIAGCLEVSVGDYRGPVSYWTNEVWTPIDVGRLRWHVHGFLDSGINPPRTALQRLGFWYENVSGNRPTVAVPEVSKVRDVLIGVPHWFVCVIFAALPVAQLVRWRHEARGRRRAAAGLCTGCGYDLQGTPERCPECGTVASHSCAAAA